MSHQACNFIKKRLQHRCFPVSIVKCLREPYLKNICERLFLSCAEAYLGLYIQPFNIFAKNLIVVWKGFHSSTVNCSPATLFLWISSKAALWEHLWMVASKQISPPIFLQSETVSSSYDYFWKDYSSILWNNFCFLICISISKCTFRIQSDN